MTLIILGLNQVLAGYTIYDVFDVDIDADVQSHEDAGGPWGTPPPLYPSYYRDIFTGEITGLFLFVKFSWEEGISSR